MLPLTPFMCFLPFLFPPWAQHSLMAPPSSSPVPQLRPMLPSRGRAWRGFLGSASPLSLLGPGAFCRTSSAAAAAPSSDCRPVGWALLAFQSPSKQSYCSYCLQKRALNHPLSPAPGAGRSEVALYSLWDSFYTAAQASDPAACPLGYLLRAGVVFPHVRY